MPISKLYFCDKMLPSAPQLRDFEKMSEGVFVLKMFIAFLMPLSYVARRNVTSLPRCMDLSKLNASTVFSRSVKWPTSSSSTTSACQYMCASGSLIFCRKYNYLVRYAYHIRGYA